MADIKSAAGLAPPTNAPPAYDASASDPSAVPSAVPFTTTFASLSLHMSDRLRLVQFPRDDIDAVRAILQRVWAAGIQAERPYSASHEFKLRGSPWTGSGTGPYAVPALYLVRDVFACLYARGWIMTASTDVSRKKFDKDTLIFRRQNGGPPPPASWMAVSFKQGDKLRLLGAPADLVSALARLFAGMRMLQNQSVKDAARDHHEFKLHGYPWAASGEETMHTRVLLLKMVEVLEMHGWSLYASIDQNNGPAGDSNYSETDSWYCVKSSDWTPGSIIIHR